MRAECAPTVHADGVWAPQGLCRVCVLGRWGRGVKAGA